MDSIQRQFKGGPPHHDVGARQVNNLSNARSSIFVTTHEQSAHLSTMQMQEEFRHHHILISQSERPNFKFDRQALMKLGALTAERNILGACLLPLELTMADKDILEKSILQSRQRFLTDCTTLEHCWIYFQDPMASHGEDSMWPRYPWVVQMFRSLPCTGQITIFPCPLC
jgi:hypothetical protein